jgi:hypothetical protein
VDFNANELIEMEGLISVGLCTFFLSVTWDSRPGCSEFSCRWTLYRQGKCRTDKKICRPTVKLYFSVALVLSVFFCRYTDRKIIFLIFLSVFAIFLSVLLRQEILSFQ